MEFSVPSSRILYNVTRRSLIDELTLGRESANMLRVMLSHDQLVENEYGVGTGTAAACCKPHVATLSLIRKVLNSLDQSLSILKCSETNEVFPQVLTSQKPEHSAKRNVCHNRRRITGLRTSEIVAASSEDGHIWRKYGQKMILRDRQTRSYYRCTHQDDQGCQARKQVQKIQDEPPSFRITYYGHHTCKSTFQESQNALLDTFDENDCSTIWRFNLHEENDSSNHTAIPIVLPTYNQGAKEKVDDHTKFINLDQFTDFSYESELKHLICSSDTTSCTTGNIVDMDIETILGSVFNDFFEF